MTTLFVRYPVFTIQTTASAISSGRPTTLNGISVLVLALTASARRRCKAKVIFFVALQRHKVRVPRRRARDVVDLLFASSWLFPEEHFRGTNQRGCYSDHRHALLRIGPRKPVYQSYKVDCEDLRTNLTTEQGSNPRKSNCYSRVVWTSGSSSKAGNTTYRR